MTPAQGWNCNNGVKVARAGLYTGMHFITFSAPLGCADIFLTYGG